MNNIHSPESILIRKFILILPVGMQPHTSTILSFQKEFRKNVMEGSYVVIIGYLHWVSEFLESHDSQFPENY